MLTHLDCTKCEKRYDKGQVLNLCECGGPLYARYDLERAAREMRPGHLALREPTMWRYHEILPLDDPDQRISLGEGFTPLLAANRLGEHLGLPLLLIKDEGNNPTGSFKARGLSMAVSMARILGATDVCLPSAGNAGSALAAYAAVAGLHAHVYLPRDIAHLFVLETAAYGAHVETVDGLISDAGRMCAEQAKVHGWYECATLKEPYRVEGKKILGYEIAEQLGWKLPDAIVYPTGGGTGLVGMWKAFEELEQMGFIGSERPRMYAVQAEGCAPMVKAFSEGLEEAPFWEGAETHAHGLRVPKALGDFLILRALRESHGAGIAVSEEEILQGVREASSTEGLFVAPEGGACVAAARKLKASGHLSPDDSIVLFNTGTGYKYVENMIRAGWETPPR
ncbi:MAG: threonine synthase [Acidobacteria bacterium]|jgi:threonine synthase|nr:threonine synthase [Acidobacteriota bacterium]